MKLKITGLAPTSRVVGQILRAFVASLALATAFPARADYPIVSQHYAADPAAVEFNGRLYVYCSNDDDNSTNGYIMSSITCFSTDDMKNWTDHGVVFRANTTSWASLSWAPSAVSNQSKVFLYFANGAGSIGVATSSVPSGPFTDARGSALITASTPGASTSTQWLFDPEGFIDDDGQAYLYFGGQYPTNSRVIRLNPDLVSVIGSAQPVVDTTNFFEASYINKRNGIYYFTYSTTPSAGMVIGCVTNSNPTNGFVLEGTVLPNPPQNVNNNNHSSIVPYQGNWYIFYHNRAVALQNGLSSANAVYKRSLCVDAINFNADGSIQQTTPTTDGLTQLKNLNPYVRVEAETFAQQNNIKTEVCSEGGLDVGYINNGSWIRVRGVDFGEGASTFQARVASAGSGGNIELHLDSVAGTLIGTCPVSPTGGWQNWTTLSCPVSGASGVHDLYLKFTGGTGYLLNVNWWQFLTGSATGSATIDTTTTYQTIEGLGGATCFYAGWITAHPYKQEIYTNAFAGLNLSMLRLGNWYRYQTPLAGFDSAATEIVSNANRVLGHPVQVYMSSWSPPAFLKSNGQVANGGTLITNSDGTFDYAGFAQYWYDSIQAYQSNGVNLTWASIQNEPDWVASYDSCIFHPSEDTVNGTNYASYSKALDAVHSKLATLPSPPKLLAPEPVHISYGDLANYALTMNASSFYGVAHHLYGDGGSTGDSFISALSSAANVFPGKPHFMTEYGDVTDMIECANLIYNELTVEQVSGYNHWSLVWPGTSGGLIQIENPFASQSTWTNAPPGTPTQSHGWWYSPSYWSMKHFSNFINPGYQRVSATDSDSNVRSTAFLSPDGLRLVVVLINTNPAVSSAMNFNFGNFGAGKSSVYQTANTNYYFQLLGSLTNGEVLPPRSLTTVVLDELLNVGSASNPSPSNGASGVALSSQLSWTPASNAVFHAVYLGANSNTVAQATPASLQFLGLMTNNTFYPALAGGGTYFWRVDEIAGVNTNTGTVWSFTTLPTPSLVHRYSFSETGGATTADSVGGPAWAGTLPNGGAFSSGQLTLASGSSQYVSLPPGIVSALTNFSIETWVKLNSTANWTRIFDFGNNTTTYMFLTPQNGSTSLLRFAITTGSSAGEQQINGTSALNVGTWNHVAVTLKGNMGVLYLNGVAVGTNSSMNLTPMSLGSTSNNNLGKSQWSDPYFNGLMDEFRIYSVALSPAEIAATDALGPDQLLSTNSPSISFNTSPSNLTLAWPLASAGFTVQSRTNLEFGNWANVVSPLPQIVGGQWKVTLPVSNDTNSTFYRLMK